MSGILKADAAWRESRPLSAPRVAGHVAEAHAIDPHLALEGKVAALEIELAELRGSLPDLLDQAREEGRRAGLSERDDAAAKRLGALEEGLAEARETWSRQLTASHGLAIEIARSVLKRMIGNPDWQADFVRQAVASRAGEIDRRLVVRIRVSPADFSEEELDGLLPGSPLAVRLDGQLGAGECVFDLEMGHQEVGARAQWPQLAKLLDELGEEPC